MGYGKGELTLVIKKADGTEIGEGPGVWIDIVNIKSMYERAKVTTNYAPAPNGVDYTMPLPSDFVTTQPPDPTMGWAPDERGFPFVPDPNEDTTNKQYVIFVHGWRQSPHDVQLGLAIAYSSSMVFAETMYKRLWHSGYRGRFAAFRWPTFYGGTSPDDDFVAGYTTYNASEYRAWKSGESLKQYVNGQPSSDGSGTIGLAAGYSRNVAAHSMGNIVVGSAFRQGLQVDQYMMLNAAVPAIAYDAGAPRNPQVLAGLTSVVSNLSSYADPLTTPTPNDDPDASIRAKSYVDKLQGIGDSTRVINFYLAADSATLSAWNANNVAFRPHNMSSVDNYASGPIYLYNRTKVPNERLELTKYSGFSLFRRSIQNEHEVMAYDCKTPTQTVNAEGAGTNGPIDAKINMATYGFASEHSAEWAWNMQKTHMFYAEFLKQVTNP